MSHGDSIERSVRQAVFDMVPETMPGASVNTIACRAEVSHHHTRQQLRCLVAQGAVTYHSVGGVTRYYRTSEEQRMTHQTTNTRPVADRIREVLPAEGEGMTALQIAGEIHTRVNSVSAALIGLGELGDVARSGEGKRGDPYVYHLAGGDLDEPDALAAELGERPSTAGEPPMGAIPAPKVEEAENGAPTSPVTPEVEATGEEDTPEIGPPIMPMCPSVSPVEVLANILEPPKVPVVPDLLRAVAGDAATLAAAGATLHLQGGDHGADDDDARARAADDANLARAYEVVIQDVEARAADAWHDAKVLDAAAELLHRIHQERLKL